SRTTCSASRRRRPSWSMRARVSSATASLRMPGVLATRTPRAVARQVHVVVPHADVGDGAQAGGGVQDLGVNGEGGGAQEALDVLNLAEELVAGHLAGAAVDRHVEALEQGRQ
ncbi:MAG TPA: hypothetical protein VFT91_01950, partial [Dehalococcoidia bacterium]|nr:hypothetical protein [Dehalococcoidia bacterium]